MSRSLQCWTTDLGGGVFLVGSDASLDPGSGSVRCVPTHLTASSKKCVNMVNGVHPAPRSTRVTCQLPRQRLAAPRSEGILPLLTSKGGRNVNLTREYELRIKSNGFAPLFLANASLSADVTRLILGGNTKSLVEEMFSRPPSTSVSPKSPLSSALAAPFFVMFSSTFFRAILLLDN